MLAHCEPVCEEWERDAVGPVGAGRETTRAPCGAYWDEAHKRMDASVEAGCQGGVTAGWMKVRE